jgi:hypothetical protein
MNGGCKLRRVLGVVGISTLFFVMGLVLHVLLAAKAFTTDPPEPVTPDISTLIVSRHKGELRSIFLSETSLTPIVPKSAAVVSR